MRSTKSCPVFRLEWQLPRMKRDYRDDETRNSSNDFDVVFSYPRAVAGLDVITFLCKHLTDKVEDE